MPYSGPNDDKLPDNVKELSEKRRSQWVSIWNDAYAACEKGGGDDCEAAAFKAANGVVFAAIDIANSAALSNYRNAIRSAIYGFWSGAIDYDQFWDMMISTIDSGLTQAWYEGAKEVGILPAELSPQERAELRKMQNLELQHVGGLADRIEKGSKEAGGKWGALLPAVEQWALRARDVRNRAMLMAQGDPKLMWELGRTEKHCSTCYGLHMKVKRASYWERLGLRPQNPPNRMLECEGWR